MLDKVILTTSGRFVQEFKARKDLRELVFNNYRIVYRIEKLVICILTY